MTRPLSTAQRDAIASANARHWLRAYVRRFDNVWIPLHDLPVIGDMLMGGTVTERLDSNSMSATIRTGLMHNGVTLSPLSGASPINDDGSGGYAPFLNGGSLIRVDACVTDGTVPVDADFVRVFEGKIDEPNFTVTPVTLTCRDMSAVLIDTTIRVKRTYGTSAGVPVTTVLQQIIDDNLGAGVVTLDVPVAPTWLVTDYTPYQVSVMDALNTQAAKFGWVVRYRFNSTGAFVLTLYDPQRDKIIADDTIAPTEYRTVDRAALVTTALRTIVGVFYTTEIGEPGYLEVKDDGAIAVFGELFIGLGGEATKDIRTQDAAIALGNYALKDLARPLFSHVIKTPLAWHIQIGDLLALTGNAVHYEDTQSLAVQSITHEWPDQGSDAATTTLEMSGKPAGAYEAWLKRQGGVTGPDIPPAPTLDFLVAEGTQFGGLSGTVDGALWFFYRMPPGVDEIRIHMLLGDGPNLGVPNIDGTTLGPVIRRPEGDIGRSPEYASLGFSSTDERYWKRLLMLGVRGGLTSRPLIPEAVQAVDPASMPISGEVDTFTVTRSGSVNTITVTPGLTEPLLGLNYVCIIRNKHILPPIPIGVSTTPVVFVDSGLDPSKAVAYAYEAFIANIGESWCVTGIKRLTIVEGPAVVAPEFANSTPISAIVANVQKVQIDWTATTPSADGVRVEASTDGVAIRVVGTGPLASGTVYDSIIGPKLYRLVATNGGADVVASPFQWFTGGVPPLSNPGTIPEFVNGTPKIVFGTTFPKPTLVLGFEWKCSTPGAFTIRIKRATAGVGGPYTIVATSADVANGTWKSPSAYITVEAWYTIEAIAADGSTVLGASSPTHYVPPPT